jgi:hypothetical protein
MAGLLLLGRRPHQSGYLVKATVFCGLVQVWLAKTRGWAFTLLIEVIFSLRTKKALCLLQKG